MSEINSVEKTAEGQQTPVTPVASGSQGKKKILDMIKRLREELAEYFCGNAAEAEQFEHQVFLNKRGEIIIDGRVLDEVDYHTDIFSYEDVWKIIEDVTGIPPEEWGCDIDSEGLYYYAKKEEVKK